MSESNRQELENIFREKKTLAEEIQEAYDNIQKRTATPEIVSGIEVIDKFIHGLTKGHLITIAARPSQGKTSLATQICNTVCDSGRSVAFVSLEMTKEQILERMFCQAMDVNANDLWIGNITPDIKTKMDTYKHVMRNYKLLIIDQYCREESELKNLFEYLPEPPDVLFVDHLQHIRGKDSRRSERETVAEYVRTLKEHAIKKKIAVIALSQINREGAEAPTLFTLKSSGAIEEMSDAVILLSQKINEIESNREVTIDIAKNRYGRNALRKMLFKSESCSFKELFDRRSNSWYTPIEKERKDLL